jgi:hypothetical protein
MGCPSGITIQDYNTYAMISPASYTPSGTVDNEGSDEFSIYHPTYIDKTTAPSFAIVNFKDGSSSADIPA